MLDNTHSLAIASNTAPIFRLPEIAHTLFRHIGEDPSREGLKKTPERFAKALLELTRGYNLTGREVVGEGIFESESTGPVSVNEIEFYSLCEHHILPFWGKASVAYIPREKILGLSKVARVVDVFSKRLQVQERLTQQIAECIKEVIDPRAVIVSVEAQHMCMMMRGVGKISSFTKSEFLWKSEEVSEAEVNRLIAQIAPHPRG